MPSAMPSSARTRARTSSGSGLVSTSLRGYPVSWTAPPKRNACRSRSVLTGFGESSTSQRATSLSGLVELALADRGVMVDPLERGAVPRLQVGGARALRPTASTCSRWRRRRRRTRGGRPPRGCCRRQSLCRAGTWRACLACRARCATMSPSPRREQRLVDRAGVVGEQAAEGEVDDLHHCGRPVGEGRTREACVIASLRRRWGAADRGRPESDRPDQKYTGCAASAQCLPLFQVGNVLSRHAPTGRLTATRAGIRELGRTVRGMTSM